MLSLTINFTFLAEFVFYIRLQKKKGKQKYIPLNLQEIIFLIRRQPHISDFSVVFELAAVVYTYVCFI